MHGNQGGRNSGHRMKQLPNGDIDAGPGSSGTITALTGKNRVIQVALKYRF
jgi:hypothetical protein